MQGSKSLIPHYGNFIDLTSIAERQSSYLSTQFIIVTYSAIELSRRVSTLLKGLIRRKNNTYLNMQ